MKNDFKWKLKNFLSSNAIGHSFLEYRCRKKQQFVNPRTDVVIEGFPRCGNTYAVASFKYYLGESYQIASHRHEIGNIRRAIDLNKTVFVIIRNPKDAVCSLVIRENLSFQYALDYYLQFHTFLLDNVQNLTVINFQDLIKDSRRVVSLYKAVNTNEQKEVSELEIRKVVEQMEMSDSGLDYVRPDFVGIPNSNRTQAKKECNSVWSQYSGSSKAESIKVYEMLTDYVVSI